MEIDEKLITVSSLHKVDLKNFTFPSENRTTDTIVASEQDLFRIIDKIKDITAEFAKQQALQAKQRHPNSSISELIQEIMLSRRYKSGTRESNNMPLMQQKIEKNVNNSEPIQLVISLFPCKVPNRLKTAGIYPDLADLLCLARLSEICQAIEQIYQPGAVFNIVLDGIRHNHTVKAPLKDIVLYKKQLQYLATKLDFKNLRFYEYSEFLFSCEPELIINRQNEFIKTYADNKKIYGKKHANPNEELAQKLDKYQHLFKSLIYTIYFPEIVGDKNADDLTLEVYRDIFNVSEGKPTIIALRKKIIATATELAIQYISELEAGRKFDLTSAFLPDAIRCDIHNVAGRYHIYSVNRSTTLTSFHSSGYVEKSGVCKVNFRINLLKESFVPVYIEGTCYTTQPFCYLQKNDQISTNNEWINTISVE